MIEADWSESYLCHFLGAARVLDGAEESRVGHRWAGHGHRETTCASAWWTEAQTAAHHRATWGELKTIKRLLLQRVKSQVMEKTPPKKPFNWEKMEETSETAKEEISLSWKQEYCVVMAVKC